MPGLKKPRAGPKMIGRGQQTTQADETAKFRRTSERDTNAANEAVMKRTNKRPHSPFSRHAWQGMVDARRRTCDRTDRRRRTRTGGPARPRVRLWVYGALALKAGRPRSTGGCRTSRYGDGRLLTAEARCPKQRTRARPVKGSEDVAQVTDRVDENSKLATVPQHPTVRLRSGRREAVE